MRIKSSASSSSLSIPQHEPSVIAREQMMITRGGKEGEREREKRAFRERSGIDFGDIEILRAAGAASIRRTAGSEQGRKEEEEEEARYNNCGKTRPRLCAEQRYCCRVFRTRNEQSGLGLAFVAKRFETGGFRRRANRNRGDER